MLLFSTADTLINPSRNCGERELITLSSDWEVPIVSPCDWAICYELVLFCFFFMFLTVEVSKHINRCWLLLSWLFCCSMLHPSILLWALIFNPSGESENYAWPDSILLSWCSANFANNCAQQSIWFNPKLSDWTTLNQRHWLDWRTAASNSITFFSNSRVENESLMAFWSKGNKEYCTFEGWSIKRHF